MPQKNLTGFQQNKAGGGSSYAGPTTQRVVTGSRTLNTAYHNTTGFPMWVTVTLNGGAGAAESIECYTDAADPPTTEVAYSYGAANGSNNCITFLVLKGNWYLVNTALTSTIAIWTEWF